MKLQTEPLYDALLNSFSNTLPRICSYMMAGGGRVMPAGQLPSIVAVVLICSVAASAVDPLVGTWALDVDQSRIRRGLRVTIERRGNAFRYASEGVEYTALLDGEDYPIRGISSHATVSLRRLGERRIQRTFKRDGKSVSGAIMTVSMNGRFLTVEIQRLEENVPSRNWVNTYQKDSGNDGEDPFAGIWYRNPVQALGNSLSTVTFESLEGGGLHFTGDQVEYFARPDGQDHKVIGTIIADSIVLDRVGLQQLEEFWKEDGKVVATVVRLVSEDGMRMTSTVAGITPQGDRFENIYVYRRSR